MTGRPRDPRSEFMSTRELAALLHLSPSTIHNRHSQSGCIGSVRPIKVGRSLLWPRDEVEAWLDALEATR